MITYKTKGVCSRTIEFDIDKDMNLTKLSFHGGCSGNLQGISKLCIGRNAEEVSKMLSGIKCRNNTSCPDQLSQAIKAHIKK